MGREGCEPSPAHGPAGSGSGHSACRLVWKHIGGWRFPERDGKSSPILPTAPAAGCPESKKAAMVLSTQGESRSPTYCLYLCSRGHLPQGLQRTSPTGPPGTGQPPERGLTRPTGIPLPVPSLTPRLKFDPSLGRDPGQIWEQLPA